MKLLSISTLRTSIDEHAQMKTVQIMRKYSPIIYDETKYKGMSYSEEKLYKIGKDMNKKLAWRKANELLETVKNFAQMDGFGIFHQTLPHTPFEGFF